MSALTVTITSVSQLRKGDRVVSEGDYHIPTASSPWTVEREAPKVEPWPGAPTTFDTMEEVVAWLDAAPEGTVVRDEEGDDWTLRGKEWVWSPGIQPVLFRDSAHLAENYAPLTVVSVGGAS